MDIWELNKLTIFVAFVIPGFVSLKAYELLFLCAPKETANQIIDAVAYSCLNYAILFPLIYYVHIKNLSPVFFAFIGFFVLFIAPVLWVCVLRAIRRSDFLQKWLPHPTERPWDYVFGKRKPYWVLITLKNGRRIGGKYGFQSFSSSGATKEQIYFEETWEINEDGGFERPRETSAGTLIVSGDVESIELFEFI